MPDTRTERMKTIVDCLYDEGWYTWAHNVDALTEERDALLSALLRVANGHCAVDELLAYYRTYTLAYDANRPTYWDHDGPHEMPDVREYRTENGE